MSAALIETVCRWRVRRDGRNLDVVFDTELAAYDFVNETSAINNIERDDYEVVPFFMPKDDAINIAKWTLGDNPRIGVSYKDRVFAAMDLRDERQSKIISPSAAKLAEQAIEAAKRDFDSREAYDASMAQTRLMIEGPKIDIDDGMPDIPEFLKRRVADRQEPFFPKEDPIVTATKAAMPNKPEDQITKEMFGPYPAEFFIASEIKKDPNLIVPYFLACTYLFTDCNERIISDKFADLMADTLSDNLDAVVHPLKYMLDKGDLDAGMYFGFTKNWANYSGSELVVEYAGELIADYGEDAGASMKFAEDHGFDDEEEERTSAYG